MQLALSIPVLPAVSSQAVNNLGIDNACAMYIPCILCS